MGSTIKELVHDLDTYLKLNEDDLVIADRKRIRAIRKKALGGYYHDFLTSTATPKMELVEDLRRSTLLGLADKVVGGHYDDESPSDRRGMAYTNHFDI